jgi:hypothetical protein
MRSAASTTLASKRFSVGGTSGGMTVSDDRKLKELESDNIRLKKIVAEQMLAIEGLKEIAAKKW